MGLEHVSAMMAARPAGHHAVPLVLGAVAEPAIAHLLEPVFHAVACREAWCTRFVRDRAHAGHYLHMLLGEMVPKNIALAGPERTALLLGPTAGGAVARHCARSIFAVNAFANGCCSS